MMNSVILKKFITIIIFILIIMMDFIPATGKTIEKMSDNPVVENNRTAIHIPIIETRAIHIGDPPNELWNKTFSRTGHDYGKFVQQTSDGGYIITGNADSSGNKDALLIKTDKDGNIEFFKTLGGPYEDRSYCVRETSDGGFIIAGYSKNSPDYDDPCYPWLVKTDENGTMLWEKKYEAPTPDAFGRRVIVLDDGFLIMSFLDDAPYIWLLKTDFDGNELWNKRVGSKYFCDYVNSIIQTINGDFVIVGFVWELSKLYTFLIKTDMNGNTLWRKTYPGYRGQEIVEVEDGSYVIAFHHGNIGLIKTNSNGEILWSKTLMSPDNHFCESLVQTSDGGFVIVGGTWEEIPEKSMAFVIKTDSDGDKFWEKIYPRGEYGYYAKCVIESDDGNYVFVGSTAEYDPYGGGPGDVWLVKLSPFENLRPNKPSKPISKDIGKPLVSYIFSASSSDPDGELLYYKWSWGNGKFSDWMGAFNNNETCEIKYFGWMFPGSYEIKVIAKDIYGGESDWSDPLTITIPRNKAINRPILQFLRCHPIMFPLLQKILLRFGL